MNMKKVFGTVTAKFAAVALVCGLATGAWGTPVARVGSTDYETIDEAVAVWGPGKTLTLLSDVTCDKTVIVEVNAAKSTQNWTLDLGNYRWTASGCHAFQLYAAGGTVMAQNYGLKVYANEAGGITATGKYCIECKYDTSTAGYRPRLEIHGGTYAGSYIIYYYSSQWNNNNISNGCSTHFFKSNDGSEPVFNGNFGLFKCPVTINAGVFNGSSFNTYPVNSTADTTINAGTFKDLNALPSASNNKGIKFGSGVVFYVDGDGRYLAVKGTPAEYEAYTSKLSSGYRFQNYTANIYWADADVAISNFSSLSTKTVNLNVDGSATKDFSISSGAYTIDASASGASYAGNVSLIGSSGSFIIKFKEDVGYYGNVAATKSGYRIHLTETVADGVVTRTYAVQSNTAITAANAEAAVVSANGTTNYYGSVYDAFYAVDGNTEGKTIKLLKDVTNASILTNGKAVDGVGKTVVTFDLNGHQFTLKGAGTGNDADYTLTVVDNSAEGTGEVMNGTFSLLKIALTGTGDYSGKYTLKVQGGKWHFDPSAVTYDGATYDVVDDGYVAVKVGENAWKVGKVATGSLTPPEEPITEETTEVSYTVPVTVSDNGGNAFSTLDAATVSVSIGAGDIAGAKLTSVNLDSVVAEAVASAGADASSVTKVEIQVVAEAEPAGENAVSYEVHPEAVVTVTKGGSATTSTIEISNDELADDVSFTFELDVTALGVAVGEWVKVVHESEDYPAETNAYKVVQSGSALVVVVTTSHFSQFTVMPLTASPEDQSLIPVEPIEGVTNSVTSVNLFGALAITASAATNAFVAVPFEAFGAAGGSLTAAEAVPAGLLSEGDKMYAYNGEEGKYDVYRVENGAWVAVNKVTVSRTGEQTTDSTQPDAHAVPAGTGVFIERQDVSKPIYVYGQVQATPATETTFGEGLTLVCAPSTNAMASVNLNALTWSGVTDATGRKLSNGTVLLKNLTGADYIYYRGNDNVVRRFYHCQGVWCTTSGSAEAVVPANTAFWYMNNGSAKVTW